MSGKWIRAIKGAAIALAAVWATSCSLPPAAAPPVGKLPRVVGKSATAYTRTMQLAPDTFAMQTGSRSFRRAGAPEIVLVGAVHVAEKDYYRALQQRLNQADLVLYEGVARKPASKAADPALAAGTAYGRLARSLGLVAQKPSIDYARPGFRRCDLSLEEMQALLAQEKARGGSAGQAARRTEAELAGIGHAMQGKSWLLNAALGLVKWSPALQEHLRLEMVGLGGRSGEEGNAMSPRLRQLIQDDRNDYVMTALDRILTREPGHRRIAIFYGAAHLQDMERRLRDRGYRPAGPVQWDAAIHAHPYAAGIQPDEVNTALGG